MIRAICVYSENKMETDPRREYDTLEDVAESAGYEIPGKYMVKSLNLNKH